MAKVTLDKAAIQQVFYSRGGPVGQHMQKLTLAVQTAAKRLAPVDQGRLRNDIRQRVEITSRGPEGTVWNTVEYAQPVHEGSRPHIIRPRSRSILRFPSHGRIVFTKLVRHPGTRANPYLRKALEVIRKS